MSISLFFFSKYSVFSRTYYNFGHTHTYVADALKENEMNGSRIEFESIRCIIDFFFSFSFDSR